MKKYRVKFSFFNLFNESSAEVVKIQTKIKLGAGIVGASTYIASNAQYTMLVALLGLVLDLLASCLYFEEIK